MQRSIQLPSSKGRYDFLSFILNLLQKVILFTRCRITWRGFQSEEGVSHLLWDEERCRPESRSMANVSTLSMTKIPVDEYLYLAAVYFPYTTSFLLHVWVCNAYFLS